MTWPGPDQNRLHAVPFFSSTISNCETEASERYGRAGNGLAPVSQFTGFERGKKGIACSVRPQGQSTLTWNTDNQVGELLFAIQRLHRVRHVLEVDQKRNTRLDVFGSEHDRLDGGAVCRHGHEGHLQGGVRLDFEAISVAFIWREDNLPASLVGYAEGGIVDLGRHCSGQEGRSVWKLCWLNSDDEGENFTMHVCMIFKTQMYYFKEGQCLFGNI